MGCHYVGGLFSSNILCKDLESFFFLFLLTQHSQSAKVHTYSACNYAKKIKLSLPNALSPTVLPLSVSLNLDSTGLKLPEKKSENAIWHV